MALGLTFFTFIPILGKMGTDIMFVRLYANPVNFQEHKSLFFQVLAISFFVSLLVAIVLWFGKAYISNNIFSMPELSSYLGWIFLSIPFWTTTFICAAIPRAKRQNNWFAFLDNPGRFLLTMVCFLALLFLFPEEPVVVARAHFFGVLILSLIAFFKAIDLFKKVQFLKKKNVSKFLQESFPILVSNAGVVLLTISDTFILGIFRNAEEVAIYHVVIKIAMLTQLSLQAINSILAPKIASFFEERNWIDAEKTITFATKANFFATCLIVLFILVFHKLLLGLFGQEFYVGFIPLVIVCVGQLINSFSGSVGVVLQMSGKQKVYQNIILVAVIINVVLNLTLIPSYGIYGAAIATAVSMAFWNKYGAYFVKKKMNLRTYMWFKI